MSTYTFDNHSAVMLCEGIEEPEDQDELIAAWQHLIDTGLVWELQGSFGRQAMMLIEHGVCHMPDENVH